MIDPITSALVSGFTKVVLKKLGSKVFEELAQIYGVKSQFKKLSKTLSAINAVLEDEEKKHGNKSISNWLTNIKDMVYDIEDLLDLISIKDLERKVNGKSIRRLLTEQYYRYSLTQKVKKICKQLDEIAKIERDFNLRGYQSDHEVVHNSSLQRETVSHIQESEVFGRQEDQEWIVSRLVEIKQSVVLPIVGMGGIGKTTLAKLVLNDSKLHKKFEISLWVYVSKTFDLTTVIRNMIQSATGESFPHLNSESLQNKLREILKDRTFLLVLDDVWVNDRVLWLQLEKILFVGSGTSAIIVSTREENVALATQTTEFHRVWNLSEYHSWSLFVSSAFRKNEEKQYPKLLEIGNSIIEKCQGNPLALKTLGSLLWTERDVEAWRRIARSEIWNIDREGNGILHVLKVSFDHTPYYLKSCFAYCAIFEKGHPIYRFNLINMWMAQGLLEDKDDNIEHKGVECVDQLLSRSFFQFPGYVVTKKFAKERARVYNWDPFSIYFARYLDNILVENTRDTFEKFLLDHRGKIQILEMHDLMHDLAAYVAGEEIANVSSSTSDISERARHIVWDKEDLSGKEFPKVLLKASKARTSAFLHPMGSLSKSFLESLLSSLKCLRVLMLIDSEFEELPDLIGDLKHLRYLDVCLNSKLKGLPNATCKLVKLQTLNFGYCNELAKLPKDMHRLVSLRCLIVTTKATCLPKEGFQCWSSLRDLRFINCPGLASLPESMGSLKSLAEFEIEMCSNLASLHNSMNQLSNLEKLGINHCQQLDLAQWDGLNGLRSLKILVLRYIPKLVDFPNGINSSAESLFSLTIKDCKELRNLPEGLEYCTSLSELRLFRCGKLSKLPEGIQALVGLQELVIRRCSDLNKRCERGIGDDWPLISNIPYIEIDDKIIQNNALPTQE